MFGRAFGKRVGGAATSGPTQGYVPAGPDPDGVTRLIPKAIWDGPNGEMLQQLGFSPDDPTNLALTPDRARAIEDAATAQMNAVVAKVDAHIPGVSVWPWAIIPWSVWEGLNAEFLIKLDFCPSSPWNNLLLPDNAESVDFLGLPLHPRATPPGLAENLASMITELRIEARDQWNSDFAAISRGDYSVLDRQEAMKNDRFQKLFAVARYVANDVFGDAVCARHDELFGIGLDEVTS